MARDYVKSRSRAIPPSRMRWFLFGVIIGASTVGGLWWRDAHPPTQRLSYNDIKAKTTTQTKRQTAASEKKVTEDSNLKFDFYTALPKAEVQTDGQVAVPVAAKPISQAERNVLAPPPAEKSVRTQKMVLAQEKKESTEKSTKKGEKFYEVRIAAYPKESEADAMRAQLVMVGAEPHVTPFTDKAGKQLLRVWLGPFMSKEQAQNIQQQLLEMGIKHAEVYTRP